MISWSHSHPPYFVLLRPATHSHSVGSSQTTNPCYLRTLATLCGFSAVYFWSFSRRSSTIAWSRAATRAGLVCSSCFRASGRPSTMRSYSLIGSQTEILYDMMITFLLYVVMLDEVNAFSCSGVCSVLSEEAQQSTFREESSRRAFMTC